LDAARWTFTSAQLQGIVSRAIRQSAEASSIRLLRLETLDDEIPPEIQRLEMQRNDVKLRYKTLARRRANLLEALSIHVEGSEEASGVASRLVEDLRDVSMSLDRLAETLHSADEQLAQLSQLCLVHSSSALAMALRKLNSSFLKQFAEAQVLRSQVESLEAERDEAWKQAEEVAVDYEELRGGKVDNVNPENRFGRVLASRKSSIRASKAGLRSSSRRHSYRSSMSSNRACGGYSPSSSKTPHEDIPPVPPIPRRRPTHIMTDIPMRNSIVSLNA
jgi:chromosome segregation ATPase